TSRAFIRSERGGTTGENGTGCRAHPARPVVGSGDGTARRPEMRAPPIEFTRLVAWRQGGTTVRSGTLSFVVRSRDANPVQECSPHKYHDFFRRTSAGPARPF